MAIHHTTACADPRVAGSASFEQQLSEDIRIRHPRLRSRTFRICGYRSLLCPNVNLPHLRQYAVQVAVDQEPSLARLDESA
jgi:hypothetical protein